MHESLAGFPVVVAIPSQWGEQDAFGHVNNIYYLRWCETARIEYCERVGMFRLLKEQNIGPIMAHVGCNFRLPVVHPDHLQIGAKVTKIGRTSLTMEHVVLSEKLGVVADATSVLVIYDYAAAQPHPVSPSLRAALEDFEGRVFS